MDARQKVRFPPKLSRIFKPHRYKVIYGGRGGSRSWSVARALLILGAQKKLRILCTREVQKTIKDSVHKLLGDQIDMLGLHGFYDVLDTVIRGANGTEFIFSGLSTMTAKSIKSFEGIDVCWCEEAESITKASWDILVPTIRKDGSEIWVTFNPNLDSDETYVRFVLSPPPDALIVFLSYMDNPWFPHVLEQERLHCKATATQEDYDNIWEGKCRSAVAGAIYAQEVAAAMAAGRVCNVPYDPSLKVHSVWDLGWNDSMSISLVQRVRSEIRIIDYIEDDHKTLDYYAALLNSRMCNWGFDFLPHDGRTKDFKTGKSAEEILKAFGRKVKITPSVPVETGIKAARSIFGQVYFDKSNRTEIGTQFKGPGRLVECLKRYRRSINQSTNEPGDPVHDEFSHGADDFRYIALNAEQMINDELRGPQPPRDAFSFTPFSGSMGY
jgi:phage terminase large subunit